MQRRLNCTEIYRTREKFDLGQTILGAGAQELIEEAQKIRRDGT